MESLRHDQLHRQIYAWCGRDVTAAAGAAGARVDSCVPGGSRGGAGVIQG